MNRIRNLIRRNGWEYARHAAVALSILFFLAGVGDVEHGQAFLQLLIFPGLMVGIMVHMVCKMVFREESHDS